MLQPLCSACTPLLPPHSSLRVWTWWTTAFWWAYTTPPYPQRKMAEIAMPVLVVIKTVAIRREGNLKKITLTTKKSLAHQYLLQPEVPAPWSQCVWWFIALISDELTSSVEVLDSPDSPNASSDDQAPDPQPQSKPSLDAYNPEEETQPSKSPGKCAHL